MNKDAGRGLRWLILLAGVGFIGPLGVDAYTPAFPEIAREFHCTISVLQLTLTAFFCGTLISLVVAGPLSDSLGRKRVITGGLAVFGLASLLAAIAPDIELLAVARFIQGAAVACTGVTQTAVVRDTTDGQETARLMSTLLLMVMIAPVIAPIAGSQVLLIGSWRWVFVGLGVYGLAWSVWFACTFEETLDPSQRRSGRVSSTLRMYRSLGSSPRFLAFLHVGGLVDGAFYVYLSEGSPVLQFHYGLSPQTYGLVFALISVGIITATQLNKSALRRTRTASLVGRTLTAAGVISVLSVVAAATSVGVLAFVAPLLVLLAALGVTYANVTALAVGEHPQNASGAASMMSFAQTGAGAVLAPVAGIGGTHSAVPMVALMSVLTLGACGVMLALLRHDRATAAVSSASQA